MALITVKLLLRRPFAWRGRQRRDPEMEPSHFWEGQDRKTENGKQDQKMEFCFLVDSTPFNVICISSSEFVQGSSYAQKDAG